MKRNIISAVIVIFGFILQSTFCRYIAFGNISPNLLIIITASFGFMMGKKAGILSGFFTGLLVDIFFGSVLGLHALLYMYIGYFNGFFKKLFFKDDLKLQILLIACSDFIYGIVYYMLLFLLRGKFHIGYYLISVILPEVVYTVLVTIIVFIIMSLGQKIFAGRENRSDGEIV